jgi:uncharacterized protein YciI
MGRALVRRGRIAGEIAFTMRQAREGTEAMKHFLLEGEHLVPFAELADLVPQHHAFLQQGYDDGVFLFSGPQIPAHGGFLVARAGSREELEAILAEEPFVKANKMRFNRITEFDAAQFQPILRSWFAGAAD